MPYLRNRKKNWKRKSSMTDSEMLKLLAQNAGSWVKYVILPDGSAYLYTKENYDALCEQTTSLQEGIPATESTK